LGCFQMVHLDCAHENDGCLTSYENIHLTMRSQIDHGRVECRKFICSIGKGSHLKRRNSLHSDTNIQEMEMKNLKWIGLAVGLFVVVAASSLVLWQGDTQGGIGVALAQGAPTATPAAPGATPNRPNGARELMTAFWNALASKLGIGVDDLKSKAVAAQKDVIEQDVKDGKLTRAQADAIEQRLSADGPSAPFFGGPRGRPGGFGQGPDAGFHGGPFGGASTLEAEAKALNMTAADLSTQLRSGKTLADVAKAQGVDEAKVKQAIIDAAKAQAQREVQDGLITQAQADQMLSRLTPDQIDLSRTLGHP
jgi:hypothetical protein